MKTLDEWYKEFHQSITNRIDKLKAERARIEQEIRVAEELLANVPEPEDD